MAYMTSSATNALDKRIGTYVLDGFLGGMENVPSDQYFSEEIPSMTGTEKVAADSTFVQAPIKQEGAPYQSDETIERGTKDWTQVARGLSWSITKEMKRRNEAIPEAIKYARKLQALGGSHAEARAVAGATILNNSFTATTGLDGSYLCVSTHATAGSTASNILATAADLAVASLNIATYMLEQTPDHRGKLIGNMIPDMLIVPVELKMVAKQIVQSPGEYGSSYLNSNPFDGAYQVVADKYLTLGNGAWFLLSSAMRTLKVWTEVPFDSGEYEDGKTGNTDFWSYSCFAHGWADWRGLIGTPGAA